MSVPDEIRQSLQKKLWQEADALDWSSLSPSRKSAQYEAWTSSPVVGGVLQRFLDKGHIRVYIKDTLLKKYTQHKLSDQSVPLRALSIRPEDVVKTFEKPLGFMTLDRHLVAWGSASDWKLVVMGIYERNYKVHGSIAKAVILRNSSSYFHDEESTSLVKEAARRIGIEQIIFLD